MISYNQLKKTKLNRNQIFLFQPIQILKKNEKPRSSDVAQEVEKTELPIAVAEPGTESSPESTITAAEPPSATKEPPKAAAEEIPEATPATPKSVKPPVAKPVASQKPSTSGLKGESWLRSQKDSHILLQLLGTHDQVALKKILNENPMDDDVAWFTTDLNGEPWYVVVKGPYKDRSSARASISSLPTNLKKRKPWPRSVADVKRAMDKAK